MADEPPLDRKTFAALARQYRKTWRIDLCACDQAGEVIWNAARSTSKRNPAAVRARRWAISEALRWGEATIETCPPSRLLWAVPIMHNAKLLGGLTASVSEKRALEPSFDIRRACGDLRELAEQHNLTNAALLATRRAEYQRQRVRAEAIHSFKQSPHDNLRRMMLVEEPAIVAAIRRGDRGGAREVLNRLLVAMHHAAGENIELIRSFFLELVVTMTRTAVESGGKAQDLLGANYASLTELYVIDDIEQLADWLSRMLEQVMDALHVHRESADAVLLAGAVQHMAEHCGEALTRDEVARVACMSRSHFSRSIKQHYGATFTELLTNMRIDRATDLLLRTDRPLSVIALECGFTDQSYFTKVFRKRWNVTPSRYRSESTSAGKM